MPSSLLRALCIGRMLQTGEGHNQALDELRQIPPHTAPIPEAADEDQAFLESEFLEVIGRCSKDRWRPHMLPFGIRSVTPRPRELIVRVPKEFLPDIIRSVMPAWLAEDEDSDPEVSGIPGLRAQYRWGRIILKRPGFTGCIVIPSPSSRWRKAVLVVADLLGGEREIRMPWITRPNEWHPAEVSWVESWFAHYSTSSWQYRNSQFPSQILRRLPGLCPAPRARHHDLWVNRVGDTCSIQFEWSIGAPHNVLLSRLLDPVFGPGARITPHHGQSMADCLADSVSRVRAESSRFPASWIDLRRAVWDEHLDDDAMIRTFGERRRSLRDAVEENYEY
jgi:hypothetical protein